MFCRTLSQTLIAPTIAATSSSSFTGDVQG
jgi:hypothetical protein